jgi:hypothetical protein
LGDFIETKAKKLPTSPGFDEPCEVVCFLWVLQFSLPIIITAKIYL